jgi:Txe/YoeB family toxin of Txe-Axe toxin-antitoxin module
MPDRHKGNFTLHALKTYRFTETDESKLLESIEDLVNLGIVEPVNTEKGKLSWKIIQNPFA